MFSAMAVSLADRPSATCCNTSRSRAVNCTVSSSVNLSMVNPPILLRRIQVPTVDVLFIDLQVIVQFEPFKCSNDLRHRLIIPKWMCSPPIRELYSCTPVNSVVPFGCASGSCLRSVASPPKACLAGVCFDARGPQLVSGSERRASSGPI